MDRGRPRRVLVAGASIAGPALAYWLTRYGFEVTLIERAPGVRAGGYAIDVRGAAIDVVDRMGILPALRAQHVTTRHVRFVDAEGRTVAALDPEAFESGGGGRHVELARGALSAELFGLIASGVRHRFGEAILSLTDASDGVEVEFRSGIKERFDVVVSGEGVHSTTRERVFGPEAKFARYLGYCFAICEIPNTFGLSHEAIICNAPGKAAILRAWTDGPKVFALFAHQRPAPSPDLFDDPPAQRESIAKAFKGEGWHVPAMIRAMREAEDFYFDATLQIQMPAWSTGRVAVVGDAAFAPSFFTGQGTSMALVGAYMMAGALATHADPALAFAAYEASMRPYVRSNQALVRTGSNIIAPASSLELWARNRLIRLLPLLQIGRFGAHRLRPRAFEALTLPDFTQVLST